MSLQQSTCAKETGHKKHTAFKRSIAAATVVAGLLGMQAAHADDSSSSSPYLSDWYHQSIGLIGSSDIRFGPYKTSDAYLEYEYFGRKGPFDLYGYVDVPRVLGEGSKHDSGITNKGSPLFSEQEPRISIDQLTGKKLGFGPFKEWYAAFDWIYDQGHNKAGRQNTLYSGIGTDIETHTPVSLSANFYVRRQWENYGAANDNSWDGYRFQMKYFYPIGQFHGGNLSYVGFFNYDFGSDLREKTGDNTRTDNAFVATNVLLYSFTHWRFWTAARYFHNGGQWSGSDLNFGDGTFRNHSTGWGYYVSAGYQF